MVGSRPITRHQREVLRIDRRWLMAWGASFVGSLLFVAAAYGIYKATGPHPEIRAFIRALKHEVRWFIPGLKRKPGHKDVMLGHRIEYRRVVDRSHA